MDIKQYKHTLSKKKTKIKYEDLLKNFKRTKSREGIQLMK